MKYILGNYFSQEVRNLASSLTIDRIECFHCLHAVKILVCKHATFFGFGRVFSRCHVNMRTFDRIFFLLLASEMSHVCVLLFCELVLR